MCLEIIANAWRAFKEAIKRLWDYYWSHSEYLLLDPNVEDLIIYQYLLEEEGLRSNHSKQKVIEKE